MLVLLVVLGLGGTTPNDLAAVPWQGIGLGLAWPALLIVILAIIRGNLVPRKTYDDQVHRADQWMAESRIKDQQMVVKDEQIAEKDKQLSHMAEVGRTVDAIMRAIQTGGRDDRKATP